MEKKNPIKLLPIDLIIVSSEDDNMKPQMAVAEKKKWKKNGTRQIQIKAEITEFDLHRVRIIRGRTVITTKGLSFLLTHCRHSTFLDYNHRPKLKLLLITIIIHGQNESGTNYVQD